VNGQKERAFRVAKEMLKNRGRGEKGAEMKS
jgi:hypothetical protein